MSATLYIYVPLPLHCSPYTNPILLYIEVKRKTNINNAIVIYKAIIMPLTCHIYATYINYYMHRYQTTISVCIPHINSPQSKLLPQTLVYTHFTLLAHGSEQIFLSHLPHCPNTVYMQTPVYCIYKFKNKQTNCNFYFPWYNYIYAKNKWTCSHLFWSCFYWLWIYTDLKSLYQIL